MMLCNCVFFSLNDTPEKQMWFIHTCVQSTQNITDTQGALLLWAGGCRIQVQNSKTIVITQRKVLAGHMAFTYRSPQGRFDCTCFVHIFVNIIYTITILLHGYAFNFVFLTDQERESLLKLVLYIDAANEFKNITIPIIKLNSCSISKTTNYIGRPSYSQIHIPPTPQSPWIISLMFQIFAYFASGRCIWYFHISRSISIF